MKTDFASRALCPNIPDSSFRKVDGKGISRTKLGAAVRYEDDRRDLVWFILFELDLFAIELDGFATESELIPSPKEPF
ncbi:hypothetical protein SH139x_001032 [Planctomycetaceae bacterium SH139]